MSLLLRLIPGNPAVGPIRGIQGYTPDPLPNRSRVVTPPKAVVVQTVAVGQATETDTAQAVSVLITEHPGVESVFQIAAHSYPSLPNKSRLYARTGTTISVGQATETDTAQAVTVQVTDHPTQTVRGIKAHSFEPLPNKSRLYAVTADVIASQDVGGTIRAIGSYTAPELPNYTRIYKSRVSAQTISVGQASETDTAQTVTVVITDHPGIRPVAAIKGYSAAPLPNKSRLLARRGIVIPVGDLNTIRTIKISGFTSGTFALSFPGGPDTVPIAWNANAATVQLALEGLAAIDPGDVICTDNGLTADDQTLNIRIQFTGQWAAQNLSLAIHDIDLAGAGGGVTSIANTQNGNTGPREIDSAQAVTVLITEHPGIKPVIPIKPYTADPLPNKSRLYARPGFTISVGQATETDTAQPVTVILGVNLVVNSISQIQAHSYKPLPNKSRLYVRNGFTILVGQAVETDTAQAITVQVTEHPSITVVPIKAYSTAPLPNLSRLYARSGITISVGQATETDTAQAVTVQTTDYPPIKVIQIKAYSADPLPNKSRLYTPKGATILVGQAVETDTALSVQAVTPEFPARIIWPIPAHSYKLLPNRSRRIEQNGYTIAVGQALETDIAQSVSLITGEAQAVKPTRAIKAHSYEPLPNKTRIYTQRNQSVPVGQALETDTAQSVTAISSTAQRGVVRPIRAHSYGELPNESRVYSYAQQNQIIAVGQALETDTAQPVGFVTSTPPVYNKYVKGHNYAALPNKSRLYSRRGITILVGQALETDTAQAVSLILTGQISTVLRAIRAFTAAPLKNVSRLYSRQGVAQTVAQAIETDSATAVKANQTCNVGQAVEIDSSNPVTPVFALPGGRGIIRGKTPHFPPQVPNLTRLVEVIAPDIFTSQKTVVSAGMRAVRVKAGHGEEELSAGLKKGRASAHQGDVTIDARLRKNRIDGD